MCLRIQGAEIVGLLTDRQGKGSILQLLQLHNDLNSGGHLHEVSQLSVGTKGRQHIPSSNEAITVKVQRSEQLTCSAQGPWHSKYDH